MRSGEMGELCSNNTIYKTCGWGSPAPEKLTLLVLEAAGVGFSLTLGSLMALSSQNRAMGDLHSLAGAILQLPG